MRISTQQQFTNAVNNMQRSQNELARLQEQISSGKKINRPSDDPVAASQIVKLQRELAQFEKFEQNISVTQRRLELQETILTDIHTTLDRMRELTIQGATGTLSDADRKTVATELRQMADYAASLMNTKDSQGEFIFAGNKGFTQPYELLPNGRYEYRGDDGQRSIQVSPTLYVPSSDSGSYLFEAVSRETRITNLNDNSGIQLSFADREAEVEFANFARSLGDIRSEVYITDLAGPEPSYALRMFDSAGNEILNQPIGTANDFEDFKFLFNGAEITLPQLPDPTLLEFETRPNVQGITSVELFDADVARTFKELYGNFTINFDLSNPADPVYQVTFINPNTNLAEPIPGFEAVSFSNNSEILLGGYRVAIAEPDNGNSYEFTPSASGAPYPPLSSVSRTSVSDLTVLQSFITGAGSGLADMELVFDTSSLPGSLDVSVDGFSQTFSPPTNPLVLQRNGVATGIAIQVDLNRVQNGERLSITLTDEPRLSTTIRTEDNKKNLLDIALDLATLLEQPLTRENQQRFNELTSRALEDFIAAADRNLEARTAIGSRINALESVEASNADFKLFTQKTLSAIQDLDYAEAISQFKLTELALQAAQSTFARVQTLSLFDYLR